MIMATRRLAHALWCGVFWVITLCAVAPVHAEVDTSKWSCKRCPFQDGLTGSVAAGARVVSDSENTFGNYTGYDDDAVYGGFGVRDFKYWGDGGYAAYVDGFGYNTDSFELKFGAGHQGKWSTDFLVDFLPIRKGEGTQTVYSNLDDTPQRLPNGWVRGGNTAGMTTLDSSLESFDIQWDRETFGFGAEYLFTPNLSFDADYRYQTKEGKGVTWGGFLTNAAQLTKPLDYDSHEVDVGVTYAGDAWQVRGSYYGSFFGNKNLGHGWRNAFIGSDQGRMAGSPDNSAHTFTLAGSYRFLEHTTASATISIGEAEQDDDFLGYTVNPDIVTTPPPRQSLDGEIDTKHYDFRITSAPWSRLRITGEYRYDDRDNKTDQATYDWVSADTVPGGAPDENLPYSFKRNDYDLFADYRISSRFKASAGVNRHTIERDFQEVDENEEDTFWGKLRFRTQTVSLDVRGETADRDIDGNYEQVDFLKLSQNPLMRKYNQADRDRDGVRIDLTAYLSEKLDVGARLESWDEDYDNSVVGLTKANRDNFVVDASFAFRDNISFYGSYGSESIDSKQWGAQASANPNTAQRNWSAENNDDFDSLNVGFRWSGITGGKWGLELDYVYAKSEGKIDINNSGVRDTFPQLETELNRGTLAVTYDFSPRIQIAGGVLYEDYDSDDWALDGVAPDTINSVLTWGANSPDYDVTLLSLSFTYALDKPAEGD